MVDLVSLYICSAYGIVLMVCSACEIVLNVAVFYLLISSLCRNVLKKSVRSIGVFSL